MKRRPVKYACPVVPTRVTALIFVAITDNPTAHQGSDLERDADLASRRQGYRLHVDARAGLALAACLPPESLALFLATCGQASRRRDQTSGAQTGRSKATRRIGWEEDRERLGATEPRSPRRI